jgi:hypothetical protein
MIKYNLKCKNDHEFESWFSDSEEFEKLKKRNLLECIYCLSKKITKSIMAPMITNLRNKKGEDQIEIINKDFKDEKNKLLKLRKYIEKNFEYVGKDFSQKVREVYYDKKNNKAVYGITTQKEREELSEEGIDLLSIPWINKDN